MKRFVTLSLVSLLLTSFASAKEPVSVNYKEVYTQLSMDFSLPTSTYYNGSSDAMPSGIDRKYYENYYKLSLTYGILEKLNFDFGLRIWQANREVPSDRVQMEKFHLKEPELKKSADITRLEDFEVGFRLPVKELFFKHSISASILIPTSNKIDPEPYNIGDGRFTFKLRYLFEKTFDSHLIYGFTGLAFYDERPENQYQLEINYAYIITKGVYAGIGVGMYIPFSMDDNTNPFETVPQDIGSFNLIPRIGYSPIENLNIELSYNYTMGGFNTYLFNTIGFNVSYLF
ncbi:MAG: hypothetical protein ACPL7I_05430 [Myxococcota bacterium]